MLKSILCGAGVAAVLLAGGSAAAAGAPSREEFLKTAIMGDNSEIKLGGMAARKADAPAVRAYGRTLVKDHTKAEAQATRLAGTIGVNPPSRALAKADAEYLKLRLLSGKGFDQEFVGYMVDDHKQDIRDFSQMAGRHDGPVSRLAARQLPTLHKHLDMAKQLKNAL
jgi:putative membrane protein